ncbi:restriction endonuclease subunit S [Algiphilus aromaticivorans]|uniref:restriction endonuclease subunit S n=1 Tax=Algiphilus aromaticivorans TaxID=382454 RepID=UPI000693C9C4|nr:restriction endonuclease subunit S [Algiphilus aromaticivorans]
MKAERLLELYDRISEAPDAVSRLRRFVLDLAVRGKLVEQNPDEQSAAERLPAKVKPHPSPHLPTGWEQAKIGQLLEFQYGKGLKKSERLDSGPVPVFGSNGIVGYTDTPLTSAPSIIVGRKGSAGALNVCDGPSWTTDVAYYVEAPEFYVLRFLYVALSTLGLDGLGKGVKPGLSRADAYELLLPVPPTGEQHSIVAKVDELMALCDRLEEQHGTREATRDRLTTATLSRLTAADTNEQSFHDHARFALDTLPALTARPDQIQALRQTLVDLAVSGKLTKSVGEEATVQGRTPEAKPESIGKPHHLPETWKWAPASRLCTDVVDCPHSTPKFEQTGVLCLDTNSFKDGKLVAHRLRYVSESTYAERIRRLVPQPGDVVFAREGSVGESVVVPDDLRCCLGQRVMLFRPGPEVIPEYFRLAVSSPQALIRLLSLHKGIGAKHVNVRDMRETLIPTPPIDVQQRIVATLQELMALCDHLEASLKQADDKRARLLDSLLAEALAPAEEALEAA